MKHKSVFSLLLMLTIGFCSLVSFAQEEANKYQGYLVWEDHVNPAEKVAYEAAVKMQMKVYTDLNFEHGVSLFETDDYRYYWVVEVTRFADIDTLYSAFNKAYKGAGEETNDKLDAAFDGTYSHSSTWTCVWHRDLSYNPEGESAGDESRNFRFWGQASIKMGKGTEMRELFKQWAELYKSKGIASGFNTYVGDVGTDMPYLFYSISAKNEVDFWTQHYETMKTLGAEAGELWGKTEALLRGFDQVTGYYREDLSYYPSED